MGHLATGVVFIAVCGTEREPAKRRKPEHSRLKQPNFVFHARRWESPVFCSAKLYTASGGPYVESAPPVTSLLDAIDLTKSFGAVRALQGVSFDVRPGEVHAVVGENGAGKSTLIKIVTGAERADSGTLRVAGEVVPHMDPASSRALGIAVIYQQPSLFPHL